MSLACVTLLGFNLPKAAAHAKVMNFTSNLASFAFSYWADKFFGKWVS
ncbi:predicted permease [Haemophilus influenzae HK1212]|uniref:Predicted permease n=1 Tax=Haemophilus influenzae HK1212 TaxID=456482 RepID=A0A7G2JYL0_HAEIF|nr:predicted permease [Haemophilus influenzae HK1212]